MPPKSSKQRKAANGYRLPDPIPAGEIITSITKKSWRLGKSIGVGGFGEIYLCSEDTSRAVTDDAPLAMKIEPHENGPLFVEMNFYIRAAQPDSVEEFKRDSKLAGLLGMPVYRGSGSHVFKGQKYRYLVMDRFGKDLESVFRGGSKLFSSKATFNLAVQIIHVLEYIHSTGYVHNDIKAQNLLLGHGRTKENDVFLVDFGLVSKYQRGGVHLEYKPDARKAHDGTIEYTSRDAHIGAHGRRSDLEILGYNLVHWMSGTLPWMDNLANPKLVQTQKNTFMKDIPGFLRRCFGDNAYPEELETFMTYAANLDFDTKPDYTLCRKIFTEALKRRKFPLDGKVDFSAPKSPVKKARRAPRRRRDPARYGLPAGTTPATSPNSTAFFGNEESGPAVTRSNETDDMNGWCWESVLCSDPEMLIRQASRSSENEDDNPLAQQHRLLEERLQEESLRNPTQAMISVIARIAERERERQTMSWKEQLQHLTKKPARNNSWDLTPNPLTPAMEEVIAMRQKRISVEIDIPITPEPSDSEEETSDDAESDCFDESENVGGGDVGGNGEDVGEDVGGDGDVDADDDDDMSSHEEYVPSSCKKRTPPAENGELKRILTPRAPKANGTGGGNEDGHDGIDGVTSSVDRGVLRFYGDISISEQREALKRFKTLKREQDRLRLENEQHHQHQQPTCSKYVFVSGGSRRISIQNDSAPAIRNKDSPPDPPAVVPTQRKMSAAAKNKAVEKWVTSNGDDDDTVVELSAEAPSLARQPKRLSYIDEEKSFGFKQQQEEEMEEEVDELSPRKTRAKASTKKMISKQSKKRSAPTCVSEEQPAKLGKGKAGAKHKPKNTSSNGLMQNGVVADGARPSAAKKQRTSFTFLAPAAMPRKTAAAKAKGKSGLRSGHGTRSCGLASTDKWKWNEIIFSNPEKMLREGRGMAGKK